jgi:asparagine synthase (glutamine-hydrolysing)
MLAVLGPQAGVFGKQAFERYARRLPEPDAAFHAQCLDDMSRHLTSLLMRHDRMGMASSIEVRVPFLENDVIDFALHAPRSWKLRRGRTKWIVKEIARPVLPRGVTDVTKRGFPMPASFSVGTEALLRRGVLPEVLGWTDVGVEELIGLLPPGSQLAQLFTSIEVWTRLFVRGDAPDQVSEALLALR